ncbi:MAG TPA: STAS/SEC14 domain-containing protein [Blastocatellia bacterium]|nr:STAS/SEC14 domain-containing protein [Blastocatellia bacterium]
MPVIEFEIKPEQLVKAAVQLPQAEFDDLVARLMVARAQRRVPHLSGEEARLLLRINRGLSEKQRRRFHELIDKRRAETLTTSEHKELLKLTVKAEQLNVERIEALARLARLRGVTLKQVMQQLGIKPPPVYG